MKGRYAFILSIIIAVTVLLGVSFITLPSEPSKIEYTFEIPSYQNANCFTFSEGTFWFPDTNYHELPYVANGFAANGSEVTFCITYYLKQTDVPLNATGTNIFIPTPTPTYTKVGEMQTYKIIICDGS